jgi:hypothetical protein
MSDELTKQSAQEYLAERLAQELEIQEAKLNRETAVALAPSVWKNVQDALVSKCAEWNAVTGAQTLTCKETIMGDLRVWCPERSLQMTVHYDSKRLSITIKNAGRAENETDVILNITGYRTEQGRGARLLRNEEIVNLEMLLVGELRVLAGIGRRAGS